MQTSSTSVIRAEPNVTPMIDVMLVLLVIFMIAIPAMLAGGSAEPPKGENLSARPESAGDQALTIDRRGEYYLNKRPIAADALPSALRAAFATRPDDHVLYLTAHKDLEYGLVQNALEVAADAGIRVVGMVSEKPPRAPNHR